MITAIPYVFELVTGLFFLPGFVHKVLFAILLTAGTLLLPFPWSVFFCLIFWVYAVRERIKGS